MVVPKADDDDEQKTTYVYEYADGTAARFYIKDDYVFAMSGEQPAFWINAGCWYPNPPTGKAAFRVSVNLVYEEGASDTQKYYLKQEDCVFREVTPASDAE